MECDNPAPPGYTGHWRDWHRGHGCDRDPNVSAPPAPAPSTAATAEPGGGTMTLTNTSLATSYHLRSVHRAGQWGGGWAICTVNDTTGELSIQSDWGSWSYRWHTAHLGPRRGQADARPMTLTEFLGERAVDGRHYIADKLTSGEHSERWRFSPEKTVADLRGRILEMRRTNSIGVWFARDVWDALGEIEHTDDVRDFVSHYYDIEHITDVFHHVIENGLREEPTSSYLVLLDVIVPALIAACGATVAERDRGVGGGAA
jgi:hypothetical protein